MKNTLATLLVLVAVIVSGCRDWYPPVDPRDPIDPDPPTYSLQNQKWCLQAFEGVDGTAERVDPAFGVFATFGAGGQMKAYGGCNSFTGSYRSTNTVLSIANLMSVTDAICQDRSRLEARFVNALHGAMSYEIKGNQLRVKHGGPNSREPAGVLVFVACDDKPIDPPPSNNTLVGPRWCLTMIEQGLNTNPERVDPAIGAYIEFDGNGGASGNGGCNAFGASYRAANGSITVWDIISTEMWCERKSEVEGRFFGMLPKMTSYKIDGDQLVLYTESVVPGSNVRTRSALTFTACSGGNPGDPVDPGNPDAINAKLGVKFDLPYGNTAHVDQGINTNQPLVLRFLDVKDSRCPIDATCIWEGEVVVVLEASLNGVTQVLSLVLPSNANGQNFMGYNISLLAVTPHLKSNEIAKPQDYKATLLVKRN